MIYLDTLQIAFIIIVPIIVIFIVGILLYRPVLRKIEKYKFKDIYGSKVYKVTLYGDYFLINDFLFAYEDNKYARIDHVMCGEKYFYIINDYYFKGSLVGQESDKSLILVENKSGRRSYVDNPLYDSQLVIKRLSMITNIDPSLMIGISIVNDDCAISVDQTSKQYYLIQSNKFAKLIKAIESRDIPDINQDELQKVIKDLDRMNKKGKSRHAKRNF